MSSELLPCPFCGGEAKTNYFKLHEWHSVMCERCLAETMDFATEQEAVYAWNTRAERTCKAVYVEQTDPYDQRWYECDSCGGYLFSYEEVGDIDLSAEMYCSKCGARVEGD